MLSIIYFNLKKKFLILNNNSNKNDELLGFNNTKLGINKVSFNSILKILKKKISFYLLKYITLLIILKFLINKKFNLEQELLFYNYGWDDFLEKNSILTINYIYIKFFFSNYLLDNSYSIRNNYKNIIFFYFFLFN